jgi:peptidoglycan/xylan/chitin deacetylase (PgdA/CDA1 family)
MQTAKQVIAGTFEVTGLSAALLEAQKRMLAPFVRALNYHDVPDSESAAFERQLEFYAKHFSPVGYEDLLELQRGDWPHEKPGLILSFDDGLASHARVVAPLLERHGFVGWFAVPVGFIDTPPEQQLAWARAHQVGVRCEPAQDGRVALSWDELRQLSGRHVIVCHTMDHVRFEAKLRPEQLARETAAARQRLEEQLGRPVCAFAWVGGEEHAYSAAGAKAIRRAGFRVGLMTNSAPFRPGAELLQIQRTNVETAYSSALVQLHLSGFYDLLYLRKRRRVERLTRPRQGD